MADSYSPAPTERRSKKTDRDPFELTLSAERQEDLLRFLVREVDNAVSSRDAITGDGGRLDKAHEMYEGGNGSLTKDTPWPGAANLGSFIVTEKVDAMRARLVATIFTDPIWVVEGWGEASERQTLVEAFHEWKAETEKLQSFLGRAIHNSLIEGTGVLEISDRVTFRKGRRKMRVLIQRDHASGLVALDADGQQVPVRLADGRFMQADVGEPYLDMVVSDVVRASTGPSFRVLSLKNFFILPGHASEKEDVWGYAKRFWRRLPELECRQRDGYYRNVDQLTRHGDREQTPQEAAAGVVVAPQYDETAEKEIWEVTLLADLDHDGYEEWYIVTFSKLHRVLLRVQYQDYGTPHYVTFTPFPRPNSVYGYSFAYDKLGSLYDEHAALRNMYADRSTLATSAPFLQTEGSPWNPVLRPFGPRKVIPVRDMNELKQLEIKDVPQSITTAIQMVLSASERLSGMNDTTTGHMAQADRTLGEVRLVTEQSWIRIDEAVKNFQEGMEELFILHHMIWQNKLEAEPEPLPGDILEMMSGRGMPLVDKRITADDLSGVFRGKPHGSVEASDFSKMRVDFAQMMTALTQIAQTVPAVAQHLNQPQVIKSIMNQLARMYRWPDRQNLVNTFTGMPPPPPLMPGAPLPGVTPGAPMKGAPSNVAPIGQ